MIILRHVIVGLWAAFWIGFLAWSRLDFVAIAALVLPLYFQVYVRLGWVLK